MLELRPNCELCDVDLPPESTDAMMCTYECTFCRNCVETHLKNVCPNCGGGFTPRPIRPSVERVDGVSLQHQPATTKRTHTPYSLSHIESFAEQYAAIPPDKR